MSSLKQQLNEQLALVAQSLSSPQRLAILEYLAQTQYSVDGLSQLTGLSVANTSQHLQVLKQAGLVMAHRQGKKRLYYLTGHDVINLITSLRQTAETHLAEVQCLMQSYFTNKCDLSVISAQTLLEKSARDEVMVLDIRPIQEFDAGHLPSAINIPPDELLQRIQQLKGNKDIVAYCRGPYCLFSHQAVEALNKRGFKAQRLEYGFPEWQAAGHPTQLRKALCS